MRANTTQEMKVKFTLCCMGASLTQNAVLCGVSSYSSRFGEEFFAQLVLAVVFPRLLVCCLQSACDAKTNAQFGEERMNFIRVCTSYLLSAVIMVVFPFANARFPVLVLGYLVGMINAMLFGTLQQIAMSSEQLQATFAFGNQLSGFAVFALAKIAKFDHDAGQHERNTFFFSVASIQLMCIALTMCSCIPFKTTDFIHEQREEEMVSLIDKSVAVGQTKPYFLQTTQGKLACLALFFTAASSSGLLPLYSRYLSESDANFSQHLFFLRLFADAISRPATVWSAMLRDAHALLFVSIVRLIVFVPLLLYFIIVTTEPVTRPLVVEILTGEISVASLPSSRLLLNDAQCWTVVLLLAMFAFSSGFISTRCYQIALKSTTHKHRAQVSASLSVIYSFAAALPVMLMFAWTNNL